MSITSSILLRSSEDDDEEDDDDLRLVDELVEADSPFVVKALLEGEFLLSRDRRQRFDDWNTFKKENRSNRRDGAKGKVT